MTPNTDVLKAYIMIFATFVKNYHRSYEVTFPSQVKRIQDLLQEGQK